MSGEALGVTCQYFTADDTFGPGQVSSDFHDAAEGPLYFFVPLSNGDAVRVPVCEEHAAVLASLAASDA